MNKAGELLRVAQRILDGMDLGTLMGAADWKALLEQSPTLRAWAATSNAKYLMVSVQEIRPSLAGVMLEQGIITEEEARPPKEGGLGLVLLIQRAMKRDE